MLEGRTQNGPSFHPQLLKFLRVLSSLSLVATELHLAETWFLIPSFIPFYLKGEVDTEKNKRRGVVKEGCRGEEKRKERRGELILGSPFVMLGPTALLRYEKFTCVCLRDIKDSLRYKREEIHS